MSVQHRYGSRASLDGSATPKFAEAQRCSYPAKAARSLPKESAARHDAARDPGNQRLRA
jgi:hypothetical protein